MLWLLCQVSLLKQDFERRERSLQQMLDQVAAGPDGAGESVRKCHFIGKKYGTLTINH